jgi:hypothetical protein
MIYSPNAHDKRDEYKRQTECDPATVEISFDDSKKYWKDDVELFLDRQRPCMQKRLHVRRAIEVSGLKPEQYVGGEQCRGYDALAELEELLRHEYRKRQNI